MRQSPVVSQGAGAAKGAARPPPQREEFYSQLEEEVRATEALRKEKNASGSGGKLEGNRAENQLVIRPREKI